MKITIRDFTLLLISLNEMVAVLHNGHISIWNSRIQSAAPPRLHLFCFGWIFCSPQSKHSTYSRGNSSRTCANKLRSTKMLSVRRAWFKGRLIDLTSVTTRAESIGEPQSQTWSAGESMGDMQTWHTFHRGMFKSMLKTMELPSKVTHYLLYDFGTEKLFNFVRSSLTTNTRSLVGEVCLRSLSVHLLLWNVHGPRGGVLRRDCRKHEAKFLGILGAQRRTNATDLHEFINYEESYLAVNIIV